MFRYESVNSTRKFTILAEIVSLLKKIFKRDAPFRAVFKVKTLAVLFSAYPREMKHIPRNLNLPPFCRCLFLWKWYNPFPRARARLKHAHSFDGCGCVGSITSCCFGKEPALLGKDVGGPVPRERQKSSFNPRLDHQPLFGKVACISPRNFFSRRNVDWRKVSDRNRA